MMVPASTFRSLTMAQGNAVVCRAAGGCATPLPCEEVAVLQSFLAIASFLARYVPIKDLERRAGFHVFHVQMLDIDII